MAYSEKELQKAKDILENCTLVSHSTKGCYSSRIALWIHYCNEKYAGDDTVTEERLSAYVEWMVNSGAAERIRQGSTHIQQVLRNQLQGVLCYWRIQTGNRPDLPDPRTGRIFSAKWNEIVVRFPREGRSRRSEPIYGAYRAGTGSDSQGDTTPTRNMDSTPGAPHSSQVSQGAGSRTLPPIQHGSHHQHNSHYSQQQQQQQQQQQHAQHRHRYPSTYAGSPQMQSQAKQGYSSSRYPQDNYQYQSPRGQPSTIATNSSIYQSSTSHSAGQGGFSITQATQPLQLALPVSNTRSTPRMSLTPEDSNPPTASDHVPEETDVSNKLSASMTPQPADSAAFTAVPGTPSPSTPLVASPEILEGVVPEHIPKWEQSSETAKPEGYLLTQAEDVVLNVRCLEINSHLQDQARAHHTLGMATWLPSDARSALTLGDISTEETSGSIMPAVDTNKPSSAPGQPAHLPKAIYVAIHSAGGDAPVSKNKAICLRHANPLQCPWSALAISLFRRWHVVKEDAPDLRTSAWSSVRLFPGLSSDSDSPGTEGLFQDAFSTISSDKLIGSKAMSDIGYFFADVFGLVRPTVAGIKGLSCVRPINTGVLVPDVLGTLARVNAGFNIGIEEMKAPRRFSIMPPTPLQKKVFPWVSSALADVFSGNNNNEQRSATRFLRLLKELRIVLLQDAAFILEVPSLKSIVGSHGVFSNEVFDTEEFMEFRSQVRKQLLDSEIREIDALYSASLDRVDEQKSGNSERLKPTAPRLVIARQRSQVGDSAKKGDAVVLEDPKQQQQQQKESASRDASYYTKSSVSPSYRSRGHGDAERKRTRLPHTQEAGPESQYENASDPTAAGRVAKRTRRVYDTISNTAAYRTTTTTSNPGEPAEPARSTTPQKAGASSSGGMSEDMLRDLRDLRMENSELKLQLRKLELALEQHQVEVHSWMLRVERSIQGYNAYHQQQQPASPELEVAPPMQPPQAAAISVSSSSHQRPQAPQVQAPSQSAHAAYPAQQRAYGDRTQQQQQPQQNSHSVSLPSIHESLNQFDRHAPTEVAGSDRYGRLRDTTRASPVDSSLPGVRGYQIPASRLPHNGDDLVNGRGAMPPQHLTNGTKTGQYQQQPQRVYSSPVQVSSPREHGYPQNALSSEYHNQQDYRGAHQQHANGIDRAEHQWYHGQHEHQQQYASRRTPPMHQHTHGY